MLSQYFAYEPEDSTSPTYDLVTAYVRLDPDGEMLPNLHIAELQAQWKMDHADTALEVNKCETPTAEAVEPWRIEAEELRQHACKPASLPIEPTEDEDPSAVDSQLQVPSLLAELMSKMDLQMIMRHCQKIDPYVPKYWSDLMITRGSGLLTD